MFLFKSRMGRIGQDVYAGNEEVSSTIESLQYTCNLSV